MSLYYVLAFLWIKVFPNASDGMLRALSAIFSVACIPVVFLLSSKMNSDRKKAIAIGLIACFLVTVNTFNIEYAQEFRSYSLTFLLTSLSTFFLIKAIETTDKRKRWFIWYILITIAAVYSHFYSLLLIAAQVITLPYLFLKNKSLTGKLKPIIYSGIGMAFLLLPIFILAYFQRQDDISWISKPTVGTIKTFLKLITGNQGEVFFLFYFVLGCIGLFLRERLGLQKDPMTRWKFSIVASCLLFPVIAALVISYYIYPIFVPKYLLYVMPYLAILAATGIVALAGYGWLHKKIKYIMIPTGIGALVVFGWLSIASINSYYENNRKTDWRSASQLLSTKCSQSLRLYYAPYTDMCVTYYNPALMSQKKEWWVTILNNNPDSDELAASLPSEYQQVCLVLAHAGDQNQQQVIQAALVNKYPDVNTVKYEEMEIIIYSKYDH